MLHYTTKGALLVCQTQRRSLAAEISIMLSNGLLSSWWFSQPPRPRDARQVSPPNSLAAG